MRLFFFIISLSGLQLLWCQTSSLELKISNDKFVLQDRYYTNGFHLTYKQYLPKFLGVNTTADEKLQLNVTLGNETYTPSNLYAFDTAEFDRPYAGWLFGAVELAKIKTKTALFLRLEVGVTGEESLSGALQTGFHDLVGIESNPTWFQEIAFKWLVNLKASKVHAFKLGESARLQNRVQGSLGSKDTYLANEVSLVFGKFNALQNSYSLGALAGGSRHELFGVLAASYTYVFLNTLIEGSPFNDRDVFTTDIQNQVLRLKAGGVLRTKRCVFKLEYIFNTKETPESEAHAFGAFTVGFNF